jgi:transposase
MTRHWKISGAKDAEGNTVGIDPHKKTLSACIIDERGGLLDVAHFKVSGAGHRALEAWARRHGPVATWGIEGAGSLGRHTAIFLIERGHDVRDVCPNRTNQRGRGRHQGKTDRLDAERIARETQSSPTPAAFKRAGGDSGPDETTELLALWHNARRSLTKVRVQLLSEVETLLLALPEEVRDTLPDTKGIRPRLAALMARDRSACWDAPTELRLRLLDHHADLIADVVKQDKEAARQLDMLVRRRGSTLGELCGLATRAVAELLVEVGDPRRFTEGGFARFNGTAPIPASSGEGSGPPARHRLNRGGNRRVNATIHRMAMVQLRFEPRAQELYAEARRNGHTKREAMRVLKRQLSNVIYRRMIRDLDVQRAQGASSAHAA